MIVIGTILAVGCTISFYWMQKQQDDRMKDLRDRVSAQVEINSAMSKVFLLQAERMDEFAKAINRLDSKVNPKVDLHQAYRD